VSCAGAIAVHLPAKFARRSSGAGAPYALAMSARRPEKPSDGREARGDERADRASRRLVVEPAGAAEIAEERRAAGAQQREQAPPVVGQPRGRILNGSAERLPRLGVLAQEERDWGRRGETRRVGVRALGIRQPPPRHLARQAQHVEHRRVVALDARVEDRTLPGARGQLEPVEYRHHLAQPVDPGQPIGRVDVLPLEKEAHEVGRAHRLDLGAQPVHRVAMNAREQRPIAPFGRGSGIRDRGSGSPVLESTSQHHPLGLERKQGGVRVLHVDLQ
jgi:hypothetical protein